MRRPVLLTAVLLASACASTQRAGEPPLAETSPAAAPVPGGPTAAAPGETLTEFDLNHDGRPDVWKYTVKDAAGKDSVLRKEKDLNGDGKVDTWEFFAADGSVSKIVYDMDFDGRPDVALFFEKDQLVRKEYAFGFDGIPHSFSYFEKGKLVRKERDATGTGRIDTWEYWENGEVDRIGVDLDGDGIVDRWESRRTAAAEPAAQK